MKHLKLFSILLCGLTTLVFTSCLNDDDNSGLTPEEVRIAYQMVKGTHSGNVIFVATNPDNTNDKTDTLAVTWEVLTDSTMIIHDLPISKIAANVTDTDLKNAIAALPDHDLNCYIGFTQSSPVVFLINPSLIEYPALSYGGATHKVQIGFYINNTSSFGMYNATSGAMLMQVAVGGFYIDGKLNSSLLRGPYGFVFEAKK